MRSLDFTEEEIQVMLDNLDEYTQDEVLEIDKLVEELSARKRNKLSVRRFDRILQGDDA